MVQIIQLSSRLLLAAKTMLKGGSPFASVTALWPTNNEGMYEIEAEGIKVALTNHGAAVANVYVKDKNGVETDVVLGLDHADLYPESESNPYLNGIIGKSLQSKTSNGQFSRFMVHAWANTKSAVRRQICWILEQHQRRLRGRWEAVQTYTQRSRRKVYLQWR